MKEARQVLMKSLFTFGLITVFLIISKVQLEFYLSKVLVKVKTGVRGVLFDFFMNRFSTKSSSLMAENVDFCNTIGGCLDQGVDFTAKTPKFISVVKEFGCFEKGSAASALKTASGLKTRNPTVTPPLKD